MSGPRKYYIKIFSRWRSPSSRILNLVVVLVTADINDVGHEDFDLVCKVIGYSIRNIRITIIVAVVMVMTILFMSERYESCIHVNVAGAHGTSRVL